MKKFKNEFGVQSNSIKLLEAFIKEIELLGWKIQPNSFFSKLPEYKSIYLNGKEEGCSLNPGCWWPTTFSSKTTVYTLPAQWDLALEKSRELEVEVPEYYVCTDPSTNFTKGKIYKAIDKYNLEAIGNFIDDKGSTNGFCGENHKHFTPSIKEAYLAQQKELQDKELLEKLIKESGFKVGDVVERTDVPNFNYTIENFILVNKKPTSSIVVEEEWAKTKTPFIYIKEGGCAVPVRILKKKGTFKILTLGDKNIKVTISKGKIEAEGKEVRYGCITNLISNMKLQDKSFSHTDWEVSFPSVKIGCSTFTLAELEQIVETFNELNK